MFFQTESQGGKHVFLLAKQGRTLKIVIRIQAIHTILAPDNLNSMHYTLQKNICQSYKSILQGAVVLSSVCKHLQVNAVLHHFDICLSEQNNWLWNLSKCSMTTFICKELFYSSISFLRDHGRTSANRESRIILHFYQQSAKEYSFQYGE